MLTKVNDHCAGILKVAEKPENVLRHDLGGGSVPRPVLVSFQLLSSSVNHLASSGRSGIKNNASAPIRIVARPSSIAVAAKLIHIRDSNGEQATECTRN